MTPPCPDPFGCSSGAGFLFRSMSDGPLRHVVARGPKNPVRLSFGAPAKTINAHRHLTDKCLFIGMRDLNYGEWSPSREPPIPPL